MTATSTHTTRRAQWRTKLPNIELKSRDWFAHHITPDEEGNIKANTGDMLIFGVTLLLDIRDLLLDMHSMVKQSTGLGARSIILPHEGGPGIPR